MPEQIADGMYPIFRRVGGKLAATVGAGAAAAAAGTPTVGAAPGAAAGAAGAPPPAQASRSTASAAIAPGAARRKTIVSPMAPWSRRAPRVSRTPGLGPALPDRAGRSAPSLQLPRVRGNVAPLPTAVAEGVTR